MPQSVLTLAYTNNRTLFYYWYMLARKFVLDYRSPSSEGSLSN